MDTNPNPESTSDIDSQPEEYSTDSLDLAAWLVCQGLPLRRLDPPDASSSKAHARFVFPATDDVNEAVSAWKSGQPIHGTDLRRYVSVKKDLYARARRVVAREGGER